MVKTLSGLTNLTVAETLKLKKVSANGSLGTANQVLTSNGTSVYWGNTATGAVTQVNTANGVAGGPITTTGTLYVVAGNNTVFVNAAGIHVNTAALPNNGVTSVASGNGLTGGPITSTGTISVLSNTGIVANTTGLFVNATYIGTLTANNTNFVGTVSAANVVSNAQLSSNLASYQTTAGLSANVATLTANNANFVKANNGITSNSSGVFVTQGTGTVVNATGVHVNATYIGTISSNNASFLGGVAAASYQTTAGLSANVATLTSNNSTFSYGKTEGALNVNSALTANNSTNLGGVAASGYQTTAGLSANVATLTSNNATNLNGQPATFYTNATNITTGTLPYAQIPANIINTTAAFTRTGITTFSANVILGSSGLSSNGGFGTAGHTLHSNGTATYWAVDDQGVTSVATGNGMTGGTITATGTVSVLANNGIIANATGVFVNANNGLTVNSVGIHVVPGNGLIASNSTGVHVGVGNGITVNSTTTAVLANTGIVANSTGLFVNSSYIETLGANNASYLGGLASSQFLRSDANDDFSGTLNYTPDTGTVLMFDGQAVIQRLTAGGGMAIGHDDILILGAGESLEIIKSNTNHANEQVYIGGESGIIFVTSPDNWATSWAGRNEMIFNSSGNLSIPGALSAVTKSFDIKHPTKEGMRLRYGSLEGPENGVYFRGRLINDNVIELPDYWTELVDEDTITVNLTAIGKSQDLWVEDIADNKVIIGGENINCFYTIFAERKDVERFKVEYKDEN